MTKGGKWYREEVGKDGWLEEDLEKGAEYYHHSHWEDDNQVAEGEHLHKTPWEALASAP